MSKDQKIIKVGGFRPPGPRIQSRQLGDERRTLCAPVHAGAAARARALIARG
jgi:hypothetical protein